MISRSSRSGLTQERSSLGKNTGSPPLVKIIEPQKEVRMQLAAPMPIGGDEIYYITKETPLLIEVRSVDGICGLLTNHKRGKKGQAVFCHSDVKNSGEEIVEFEKVNENGDSRIANGEVIYIRTEGLEEDTYCYLKGQTMSQKCTWGTNKDSSTKSQFQIRIKTNYGKGYLTGHDSFEIVSCNWKDHCLHMEMERDAAHKDQCGMAVLKRPKDGDALSSCRATETILDDRIPKFANSTKSPISRISRGSRGSVELRYSGGRMSGGKGAVMGGGKETVMTVTLAKDCPYCGMILNNNADLRQHLETAHVFNGMGAAPAPPARSSQGGASNQRSHERGSSGMSKQGGPQGLVDL